MGRGQLPPPDISEKGAPRGGQPQRSDRRLFMQLLAFGGCRNTVPLVEALRDAKFEAVLYEDVNDPTGVALLLMSEEPAFFVDQARPFLLREPFTALGPKPNYTMFGRSYSIGYEPDLEHVLLHRPRQTALNPDWPWSIWYPLRRSGAFMCLDADKQRDILKEHGGIGMAFGQADYAHDIRLACHGLDRNDNDFVIGLMGKELFGLSAIIQTMRKTVQTSQYLEKLGPFFVGRAIHQSPLPPAGDGG